MENIIIETNENDKFTYTLKINTNALAPQFYSMYFKICQDPICPLLHVDLKDISGNDNHKYDLSINIKDKSIITDSFSNLNKENLTQNDWEKLKYLHQLLRENITREKSQKNWKPNFPMHKDIDGTGVLVFYNEINPHGDQFTATTAEGTIVLYDSYCVKPNCNCKDAQILFPLFLNKIQIKKEPSALRFDYHSGKILSSEKCEVPRQAPPEVMALFLEKYPNLKSQLALRHQELKKYYTEFLKKLVLKSPKVFSTDKLLSRLPSQNGLCQCGSGKKFKRCCGLREK